MRRFIPILISSLLLPVVGCVSPQKKVAQLQAQYDKLDTQYKSECDDPWDSTDPKQAPRVLHDESLTPADDSAFRHKEKQREDRIASPHCRQIEGERKQLGTELIAAQNKAVGRN